MILKGDCIEVMKAMKPNSVDAIVTDPPYGLEFMGKEWDKLEPNRSVYKGKERNLIPEMSMPGTGFKRLPQLQQNRNFKCKKCGKYKWGHKAGDGGGGGKGCECENPEFIVRHYGNEQQAFHQEWLTEAYRVLKPGGSMLVMGGTRTFHRLACAIEDSGFIIKDTLMWLYGSGFPKAQDLGKMIKKKLKRDDLDYSAWDGFKVGGIKPAYEPIIWAVKPPEGSYVDNVLKWGVGAVNVDECRISSVVLNNEKRTSKPGGGKGGIFIHNGDMLAGERHNPKGRFPANIILDEEAGRMLDEQSGDLQSGENPKRRGSAVFKNCYGEFQGQENCLNYYSRGADSGGASRFFYCAKASRSERNAGLEGMEEKKAEGFGAHNGGYNKRVWIDRKDGKGKVPVNAVRQPRSNSHPTVKPIKLFEYLIKLVTREGQIVLDPFIGSGTSAIAAHNTGRKCIGIEKEGEYLSIANRRIDHWRNQPKQNTLNLGE